MPYQRDSPSSGGQTLSIGDIRVPKASDVLAERLRRQILDGLLPVGAPLPAERTLVEETGLSRTVVREALRVLESQDLIVTRPGRNGGSVVRRPDVDSFARSLDVFIRGRSVRFHSILETRELVEPICAHLAAERRTTEEIGQLERVTADVERAIGDVRTFLTANVEWHVTVALMSHNELLAAFMQALSTSVRASTDVEGFTSPEIRRRTTDAHARVVEAIRRGDGPQARHMMQRHLQAYRSEVLRVAVPAEIDLDQHDDQP